MSFDDFLQNVMHGISEIDRPRSAEMVEMAKSFVLSVSGMPTPACLSEIFGSTGSLVSQWWMKMAQSGTSER